MVGPPARVPGTLEAFSHGWASSRANIDGRRGARGWEEAWEPRDGAEFPRSLPLMAGGCVGRARSAQITPYPKGMDHGNVVKPCGRVKPRCECRGASEKCFTLSLTFITTGLDIGQNSITILVRTIDAISYQFPHYPTLVHQLSGW